MRRLWSYLLIAFASIFIMGATFTAIFKNVETNQEFNSGREIVFRLTDKEDVDAEVSEGANKEIATQMAKRLDNSGVNAYRIDVSGDDIIKVTLSENNDVARSNIINYLSFNGSLALSNMDDNDNYYQITGDEFLLEGKEAYLSDINNYPTVVIPVNKDNGDFQLLLENTRTQLENGVGEKSESQEKDEDGNPKEITTTYLYLWYDFNEDTDRYSRTVEGSDDYDANIAKKIIMKFNIEDFWYPDDEENKLAAVINLDANGDQSLTYTEVRNGYDNARFYVNLLNSSKLDYDVKYINDNFDIYSAAWSEIIVVNGDPNRDVAWSHTLIATLIAVGIISLLLVVFFKLSSLSIITSSLLSVFGALGLLVALTSEFNTAALLATVLVAIASLACGIIYACKLKDEAYKGRSLKKANSEAARKSLLPTIDISLVVVAIGAFAYLFGGTYMRSFALIAVLGGILTALVNLILTRGMMWLATNTTALNGKYNLFAIDNDKVPSIEKEEKQTYFGPYQDKNFTKNRKPIGFIALFLCAVGLGGLIVGANLYNGQYYKDRTTNSVSEVYFYTDNEDSVITTNNYVKETILGNTYLTYEGSDAVQLSTKIKDVVTYAHSETKDGVEVTTTYVVASFNSLLNGEQFAYYGEDHSVEGTLNEVLSTVADTSDTTARVSLKSVSQDVVSTPNASGIMLGTVVATLVMGLYFMIRYRLSRGLTAIIVPLMNFVAIAGIFSLITLSGVTFGTNLVLIMPFISAFTMILSTIWMNRERELVIEDKLNDKSFARREELMIQGTSSALVPAGILTIIAAYLLVDFFGFGASSYSTLFVTCLLGVATALLLVTVVFGPIAQIFYKRFSRVNINLKPKKKKKKSGNIKPSKSSGEPEEAIFIGIND